MIGLTEESVASAYLFHTMFGASPGFLPYVKIPMDMYRKNQKNSDEAHDSLLKVIQEQKWSDSLDDVLYDHVSKLFYERCAWYNITTRFQYKPLGITGKSRRSLQHN
jgi:hypothetical protein